MKETLDQWLGLNTDQLSVLQMGLRTVIIFILMLVYIRLCGLRLLGRPTAIDFVVSITFGAIMAKAVAGSSPFLPTIVSGAILIVLNWIISWLAFRSHFFGKLVKGEALLVVKDGQVIHENMRRWNVTEHDILESLRSKFQIDDIASVRKAYLERNGQISAISQTKEDEKTFFSRMKSQA